jgi:hypothetical protein
VITASPLSMPYPFGTPSELELTPSEHVTVSSESGLLAVDFDPGAVPGTRSRRLRYERGLDEGNYGSGSTAPT